MQSVEPHPCEASLGHKRVSFESHAPAKNEIGCVDLFGDQSGLIINHRLRRTSHVLKMSTDERRDTTMWPPTI